MMRQLIPGLTRETDKATVMEHAVDYLLHLSQCGKNNCNDYQPNIDWVDASVHVSKRGPKPKKQSATPKRGKRTPKASSARIPVVDNSPETIMDAETEGYETLDVTEVIQEAEEEKVFGIGAIFIEVSEVNEDINVVV